MTLASDAADNTVSSSVSELSIEKEQYNSSQRGSENFQPSENGFKPEELSTEDAEDMDTLSRIATSDYPHALKLTFIVIALVLSIFLVALDSTIVATAIPRITDEFHSLDQVGWYGSAFFLTLGAFQSTWGKAYKYFPLKPTFLITIGIFELGSLICGVAQDSTTLIVGRAIAGKSCAAQVLLQYLTVPRHGRSWHRIWRVHHHRICSTTRTETCFYWPSWGLVRMRQCRGPSARGCFYFSRHVALVLLRQPTHRWRLCIGDLTIFPSTCSFKASQSLMARENPSNGSTRHLYNHGGDCLLSACTSMGWCD